MNTGNGLDKNPQNRRNKPKGALNWSTRIRMYLEENEGAKWKQIIEAVTAKALDGDVRAAEWLADRTEGRPQQTIEMHQAPTIEIIDYGSNEYLQAQSANDEEGSN